ncbi:hypothetical protein OG622_46635 [Streptomyces sp. NBC_01314]|nr:hypothetical protein OG622_46635 [Streptomyces sp. NBC_01314]
MDLHRRAAQLLPQQVQQLRRTEVHSEVVTLGEHVLELDAERPTYAAVASVAGHQVRAGQRLGGTARHVAHHGQENLDGNAGPSGVSEVDTPEDRLATP